MNQLPKPTMSLLDGATGAGVKPRSLGSSLPVANVQDLAARSGDLTPQVLHRYLRDAEVLSNSNDDAASVPIVNLGRLLDPEHADEESAKLRYACEDWGFFQVLNHGVPGEIIDDVKENLKGFFQLPLAEKQADSLVRYSVEVQRVATDLLRIMAKNLGVADTEKLTTIAGAQSMRMNYYPPCPQAHDKVLGLSPHSDAVGLTLLLQVSPVTGLQIRHKGEWIPVTPLPGALIANVGDVIEVLTNGRYKSIEHRAVVNAREERVSVATFHQARFGEMYGPLEELVVGGGEAPRYRTISVEDYLKLVFSSKLDGKNIMDAMKIIDP
ncbi:hypothetical protein EJB05_03662, partial [Eragrostis curvula]